MSAVGFCPSCNRSVLVEVREWHLLDGYPWQITAVSTFPDHPVTPRCCVYADCPHCGGDIDQYEGAR